MVKSKSLLFLILSLVFAFPAPAADLTTGTDGTVEKRENGGLAVLPAAYFLAAADHFSSPELSFFADAAGRESWDAVEGKAWYDFSLSGKTSYRRDKFFFGLDAGTRVFDSYEEARELRNAVGGNIAYNGYDISVFLKPTFSFVLKDVDYYEIGLEPGVNGFLFSLVYTLSLPAAFAAYEDGTREYSLNPGILLDWYPSIPFNLTLRSGYSRSFDSGGSLLAEEYRGETALLWQPVAGFSVKGSFLAEAVLYRDVDSREYSLYPGGEFRWDFSGGVLGGTSFVLTAGEKLTSSKGTSWDSSWFVRIGVEKEF